MQIHAKRRAILAPVALVATILPALAQRASENAVTAAGDAFGTSVGDERIGLYNPNDVRGFSPLQAGNVRLDGLYFDQVGDLNDRLQQSSRIRVGITAQGYAFPAPTGIVDYTLRVPGDRNDLSILAQGNSFGSNTLQLDGALPVGGTLSMGGGIGYQRNEFPDGGNNYEATAALLFHWQPLANLEIIPFWSRKNTFDNKNGEFYEPAGDFLPSPVPPRHFFGPNWVKSRDSSVNYGTIVNYSLSSWLMRLGVFRSERDKPEHFFPLLVNLEPDGLGDLNVYADPPARFGSTSGEFRLGKNFSDGDRVHRLIFSLRERNWSARYGDSDIVDAGPQAIGQAVDTPKPILSFTPPTRDHVDERMLGFGYQMEWKGVGQIDLGAQKIRYHKATAAPAEALAVSDASPWLLTMSGTGDITAKLAFFASYTQGLEESGIAPSNAANSNQALPAITTRQKEAGLRWTIMPGMNMSASLFDLKKPYFNLDPSNLYRDLGQLENKGLELSLAGNLTQRLVLVAGAVLAQPTVSGDALKLGITGDRPVGIPARKFVVNANWQPPGVKDLSFDAGMTYFGAEPGTLDDVVIRAALTTFDLDARYKFELGRQAASLKFAIMNITDVRGFHVADADTYGISGNAGSRRIDLRLIVDMADFS